MRSGSDRCRWSWIHLGSDADPVGVLSRLVDSGLSEQSTRPAGCFLRQLLGQALREYEGYGETVSPQDTLLQDCILNLNPYSYAFRRHPGPSYRPKLNANYSSVRADGSKNPRSVIGLLEAPFVPGGMLGT